MIVTKKSKSKHFYGQKSDWARLKNRPACFILLYIVAGFEWTREFYCRWTLCIYFPSRYYYYVLYFRLVPIAKENGMQCCAATTAFRATYILHIATIASICCTINAVYQCIIILVCTTVAVCVLYRRGRHISSFFFFNFFIALLLQFSYGHCVARSPRVCHEAPRLIIIIIRFV